MDLPDRPEKQVRLAFDREEREAELRNYIECEEREGHCRLITRSIEIVQVSSL